MGYRPHFVEEKKYGETIGGFSYKVDAFQNILMELGLEVYILNDDESIEISAHSIRNLSTDLLENADNELKSSLLEAYNDSDDENVSWDELKDCLSNLIQDLKSGLNTKYCQETDMVLIEWF